MSPLILAIIIFVVVFALVLVGVIFFVRTRSTGGDLVVKQSLRRKDEIKKTGKEPKQAFGAEDTHNSISRNRTLIFGGISLAALAVLMGKSWALQILSGSEYSALSKENMTATANLPATRGRILDRNGVELVKNQISRTVVADDTVLENPNLVHRLSLVLGIPKEAIRARLMDETGGVQSSKAIASDVSMRAISFISENPAVFPGISIESRFNRIYPNGSLAAHVLGYSGTISEEELKSKVDGMNYASGDVVGKSGAEQAFERLLQGNKGTRTYKVDSDGKTIATLDEIPSDPGNDVKLTINYKTQKAAEKALAEGLEDCRKRRFKNAYCGAVVAMDVHTGAILAMASAPTFNPNNFIGGISSEDWEKLNSAKSNYPMNNRAISGVYPAASTFKAFTGLAGLTHKMVDKKTEFECKGTWVGMGRKYPKKCWLLTGHGDLAIVDAISNSCDVYFYEIAKCFYEIEDDQPTALQDYLRSWGFGAKTGIELAGESEGRIPTKEWKEEYFKDNPESSIWLGGDLTNLIIGQGDVLITPLQLACAYSGIATGKIPKPHIRGDVLNKDGQVVLPETFETSDLSPVFSEEDIQTIREGLRAAVTTGGVAKAFQGFGAKIAAKSGTGETGSEKRDDYAWIAAYGPYDNPKYCVTCVIEQGGGGTSSAGPIARKVLAQLLGLDGDKTVYVEESDER
ncbi:MAG: penicillin-binding protein 2 [bacterium]|nr:penicillin-binding protein 2 [bacterium]